MIKTSVNVEELGPGDEDLLSWIQAQMHLCLQTMKKPDKGEISLLTSLIAIYGIVTFRDSILPQIQNHLSSAFLSKLAISISKETQILASDDKTELISDLVKAAISKLKLRQPKPTAQQAGYPYPHNHAPRPKMQGDLNLYTAKKYIEICISLHLVHHLGELFDKAADVTGMPEATVQTRLKDFMLPLMTFMRSVKLPDGIQVNQVPRMAEFAKTATKLYVASLSRTGSSMSSLDGQNFMSTVIAGGGWDLLKSSLLPKVDYLSISTNGLLGIVAAIHAHKDKLQESPNLQDVIISLMNKCVTNANCVKADDISIILKACIEVQAFPSVTLYLNRIAHASNLKQDYIKNTLIPLIPHLRELGLKYNMLDTFASTFQFIIAAWISKCLGPKPVDDSSTAAANVSRIWSCSCYECASVKKFLTQPPVVGHPSLVLSRIGAPKRKHIERELTSCYAREISTWEMIMGNDHGKSSRTQGEFLIFHSTCLHHIQKLICYVFTFPFYSPF
ncbi:hypothetical protein C8Q75DRAFT_587765 [Abortiporus biennis]|nr:hypothetical protein C8Q75DRAFT_587765 [Abortiporus biennis]